MAGARVVEAGVMLPLTTTLAPVAEAAPWYDWRAAVATALVVLPWVINLGLLPVVLRRHRPPTAIAWLAIIFVQPYVGAALYAFFGRRVLGRRRIEAHDRATAAVMTPERLEALRPHESPPEEIPEGYRDLLHLARSIGKHGLVRGNAGRPVREKAQFIDALIDEIDRAESTVHLLYYIWRNDTTGRRVTEAVERAAARGVTCRVLADGVGSRAFLERAAPRLRRAGAQVRATMPVRLLRARLARIDVRNHRKLAVFDGRRALTGSHNVCDADYGHASIGAWQDISSVVTGPLVRQLQLVFLEDWASETGDVPDGPGVFPEIEHTGEFRAQALPSGPGAPNEGFREMMISLINEANHSVVMTTPYFVPDEASLLALRLRAMAGLEVKIIVPARTNSKLVNAACKRPYLELAEAGAEIHLHRTGLLHAKTITIDGKAGMFGSGNFDRRSFSLNYELNILIAGPEITSQLRAQQEAYLADSDPLDADALRRRSTLRRLFDDAASLLGPLL